MAKTETVDSIIKDLNKEERMISTLDDIDLDHPRIPTGVISVDSILGGGFPTGRIVDVYGKPGGGKTALMLRFAAEAQKRGKVIWVDLENAFDPQIAENSGINLKDLLFAQPDSAEKTLEMIEKLVMGKDCAAIIVDSFAGMVPEAELEGDIGDSHVGLIGRLTSQSLRRLTKFMANGRSDTIVCFINQLRANIGGAGGYGPTTTVTGGMAIKFYASTRLEVTRVEALKKSEEIIGQKVKVKAEKNRMGKPFATTYFDLYYDRGISNESGIVDAAVTAGLLVKNKSWYVNPETGENLANGKPKMLSYLEEHPEFAQHLERELTS